MTVRMSQRGVALVIVLWALTVIAVIAANFTTTSRDGVLLARNTVERAKAEAFADAGVYRAVLALVNQEAAPETGDSTAASQPANGPGNPLQTVRSDMPSAQDQDTGDSRFGEFGPPKWRTDGAIYEWPFADATVMISIQDEAGKIDLNAASEDLLLRLFSSIDLSGIDPETMVDRLLDYRDSDQERRPHGAEDIDYQRADLDYGAKDRPLERTDELLRVLGMTPQIYAQLAPMITVYSGRSGVEANVAPTAVLGVMGTAGAAIDVNADRAIRELTGRVGRNSSDTARGHTFTIIAEAHTAGGGIFSRQAVVEVTGDRSQPIRVREWAQAAARLDATQRTDATP